MLRAFFDFGERIGWEACAVVGAAIMVCMFAGFTVELIILARKVERR